MRKIIITFIASFAIFSNVIAGNTQVYSSTNCSCTLEAVCNTQGNDGTGNLVISLNSPDDHQFFAFQMFIVLSENTTFVPDEEEDYGEFILLPSDRFGNTDKKKAKYGIQIVKKNDGYQIVCLHQQGNAILDSQGELFTIPYKSTNQQQDAVREIKEIEFTTLEGNAIRFSPLGDVNNVTLQKNMVTYACNMPLDFSTSINGLNAYVVTRMNDEGKAVLTKVNGPVPAGTGLILQGTAGLTYAIPYATTAAAITENLLVGVNTDTAIGGNGTDYILKDGKFVKANAGILSKGKAYLRLDLAHAQEIIDIDIETTNIILPNSLNEATYYNLNGQRISNPQQEGLYIVNGKKIVKK